MVKLARVANPTALDSDEGRRASLSIGVPAAWLEEGAELEIEAPKLLACDRCDGGGCDGCARSGALRAPERTAARRLVVRLPPGDGSGLRLRLPVPFDDPRIAQLIVSVTASERADVRVRRLDQRVARSLARRQWLWLAAAVALALGVLAWAALSL